MFPITHFVATHASLSPHEIAEYLLVYAKNTTFVKQLKLLKQLTNDDRLIEFGNGIEAHESVITAIGCFALHPNDFQRAIQAAIWLGGDTDTIAAMTGALIGTRLGLEAILPFAKMLEPEEGFGTHVAELAGRFSRACN